MRLIVVGCGRVGAELAYRLFEAGHDVTVIDESQAAFEDLASDFRGRTVEGEVLAPEVLHRAGIENAEGLAAVTSSDSLNAIVAQLARERYGIRNVVVRNYNPRHRALLEAFSLPVVSPGSWGAQRIEELLTGTMLRTVFSAGNGEVEVYEILVPKAWHGRRLGEFNRPGQRLVSALARAGRAVMPARRDRDRSK